ncbi:MAG: glycosyltransferase family 4 protein [Chloroflexi bacterium]|nr:glycosyltransferase family 4 protein [Chloroflexota bacterium]
MKRNLLIISAYSGLGGGESVQLNLMRALDTERFALHLVCPRDGQWPQAAREAGARVHLLPYRGATMWFWPAIWKRFPMVGQLTQLLCDEHIDVIHSDYHSLPFAVGAAQRLGNIPVIWNAMGWWFPARPWQLDFFEQQVSQIIAITRAVRDRWLGDDPFMSPNLIEVLVPGVDPDHFHPGVDGSPVREKLGIGPDVPLVGMIARFQEVKGHDVFQAMAKLIHREFPQAHFAVAGENVFGVSKDEAYKNSILTAAREDPVLSEKLSYLGFWPDAREVIAAADVMVCPSRFESLGMVHLESMAMGCPVVSMNNGGPAETVIHGQTGFLVAPGDPEALAERVLALLRDPGMRSRLGKAGRAHVLAGFTAAGYARQIEQVIDRLLETQQGAEWKS